MDYCALLLVGTFGAGQFCLPDSFIWTAGGAARDTTYMGEGPASIRSGPLERSSSADAALGNGVFAVLNWGARESTKVRPALSDARLASVECVSMITSHV
eukprot:m.335218 g.335218  ORF g.335218 m.335218 type:complete len:100 (+) comp20524_c1_seq9:1028-1327(+)